MRPSCVPAWVHLPSRNSVEGTSRPKLAMGSFVLRFLPSRCSVYSMPNIGHDQVKTIRVTTSHVRIKRSHNQIVLFLFWESSAERHTASVVVIVILQASYYILEEFFGACNPCLPFMSTLIGHQTASIACSCHFHSVKFGFPGRLKARARRLAFDAGCRQR